MNLTDKANELLKAKPLLESVANETKRRLPMKLQFFADNPNGGQPGDNPDDNPDANKNPDNKDNPDDDKTFTRSEVDSEISKAVDKALKNREAKHQQDLQKAIDDALAEKERLSKLSEKERKDEELSKKEKKLLEREAEIARKELLSDAKGDLTEKGLPTSFAEWVLAEDAEKTLENINTFKKAFDEAVNAAVKEKLRQDTPPAGGGGTGKGVSSIAALRNKKDQQQNKAPDLWAQN